MSHDLSNPTQLSAAIAERVASYEKVIHTPFKDNAYHVKRAGDPVFYVCPRFSSEVDTLLPLVDKWMAQDAVSRTFNAYRYTAAGAPYWIVNLKEGVDSIVDERDPSLAVAICRALLRAYDPAQSDRL